MRTIEINTEELDRACICTLERDACPNPRELGGGSQFPGMSCEVILAKLALQERRIRANNNASDSGDKI